MSINLINEPDTNLGEKLLNWQFPEFRAINRTKSWWITATVLLIILLIYSIWDGNFLFAVIIITGAIIIWLDSRRQPKQLSCSFYQQGLTIGQRFWPWKEIGYFWIAYKPPEVTSIYLQPKSNWQPRLSIPLNNTNPLKVREILTKYAKEDLEREDIPTSEALSRLLRLQ